MPRRERILISASEEETIKIAQQCADEAKTQEAFMLQGPMGVGKSVFARAFIRRLCGHDTEVPSPTFTLVQHYEGTKGMIYHFDLYRLRNAEEIYELGWEEALTDGILLVEWPERLGGLIPPVRKEIIFSQPDTESRSITIIQQDRKRALENGND